MGPQGAQSAGELGCNNMTLRYLGRLAAGLLLSVTLAGSANATVRYAFDFFDLFSFDGPSRSFADFSLVLETPDYITVTGMSPLAGDPLPTSLGYSVQNAGTNKIGGFGFSNAGGSIADGSAVYSSTTFVFMPNTFSTDYIRTPGVFAGTVFGSSSGFFSGKARLTVTDTLAVPEPATWAVMILGLGVAGVMLRRRSAPLQGAA